MNKPFFDPGKNHNGGTGGRYHLQNFATSNRRRCAICKVREAVMAFARKTLHEVIDFRRNWGRHFFLSNGHKYPELLKLELELKIDFRNRNLRKK